MERNTYDAFVQPYADMVRAREATYQNDADLKQFFDLIGDVHDLDVLDAGCGEGFVAHILSARGARVTAVDISESLVELGRSKGSESPIDFWVADLSQPLPEFEGHFDLVAANYVLNDVPDYRGFVATIASMTKLGGRLVLSLNNPYSAVFREKASNYFDSGTAVVYQGLAQAGIEVYYYHRAMTEYVAAFWENGLLLRSLVDIPPQTDDPEERRCKWHMVPFLMIIELIKG
jgi:2-polyprenyl-3-methyl-5-hydroxy-6-metoxy-1,4-benzoquinol methylase